MPQNKIILGIDPGLATTGYGIIIKEDDNFLVVNYGTIDTAPVSSQSLAGRRGDVAAPTREAGGGFADRLEKIHNELDKIIKKYKPDVIAVEELFFAKNAKTALLVGQARGVIILTAIQSKAAIHEYTPLQIKQALTGYGRADKNQIQQMVRILLKLKSIPKPDDAADALAVAICCSNSI
ncbi:MAG: crossover junction endodeoxyribonuclease RuvC [bacterium]